MFLLHDSVAVVLGKKNDLTNQLPQIFFFRVDNAKFLNLFDCICAKITFGRKVAFLGDTSKNWFVIFANVNGNFTVNIIVIVFYY